MSYTSSGNLKLNFLFLITIFRLDISRTLAQDTAGENQFLSNLSTNDNVLVHDNETITTTIYLGDENSLINNYSTTMPADYANNRKDAKDVKDVKDVKDGESDHSLDNGSNNEKSIDVNSGLINIRPSVQSTNGNSNIRPENGDSTSKNVNDSTKKATPRLNRPPPIRQMSRDEWLAKEYFSYLCASENCVNSEMKQRIIGDCFSKHGQLTGVMDRCLVKGRCDNYLICVLNECKKVSSVWFCYSLLFFKLYFTNTMAGCLVLVGQVSDAIITPVIGVVCDRQTCSPDSWFLMRAGKRKFWHIIGTLLLMIAFPLSYTYPLLLENDGAILKKFSIHTMVYVLIIALFQASWAKVQVSHVSLITDLTSLQNERVALNAYRQAATVLANLFIYVLMLLMLNSTSDGESEAFSKKDAKIVAVVSVIACVVGLFISIIFYILVKEPGQCLLNRKKHQLALANKILNANTPEQTNKSTQTKNAKNLDIEPIALPETLNKKIVGSTENSDYCSGVYKQTSFNDITPYYYPTFYYYPTTGEQAGKAQEMPSTPIKTIPSLMNSFVERPKLMHSVSIDTTVSEIVIGENNKTIYKKKGELEKKKSKLSLRNMAVPVKRMFSVDARRQFNCKDWLKCSKFWKVGFIYMMARLFFNTTQAYTTLYLTFTLKLSKSSIAIVPFVVYISGFVVSLLARPLSTKIGSRYVLAIGCVFSIVSSVWFNFGDRDNESFKQWQVYGATIMNGIGCTSILISSMAITTDLIGDNKNSGFVFASMSFLDKLLNGLAVYFIEFFNPEVPAYYQLVLVYAAGGAVVFTLIGLVSLRGSSLGKLDKNNDNMLKELVTQSQQSTPPIH